ncbi:DciA family protein [Devosia rhodophyticola]|uniref:DciA family protein n=1 Tax=Devosia rhodophyticola TaxID=3026423 RepID=A0ABY7YYX8_9HYPH|nr:DciA family protein [Devosia rhodophyticola]WDR06536.1 DciA family protein [Devosia rhodophyticola]
MTFRRRNRTVGIADALTGALDPVLKKRGFASQDILSHWAAMAPAPYDQVAMPDKLSWPRGERSAEGATLYLRCVAGHSLAIAHEGTRIAAAVNRYFGYILVGQVRLSAEPFTPGSAATDRHIIEPSPDVRARVGADVEVVDDDGVREALRNLGHALAQKNGKRRG